MSYPGIEGKIAIVPGAGGDWGSDDRIVFTRRLSHIVFPGKYRLRAKTPSFPATKMRTRS